MPSDSERAGFRLIDWTALAVVVCILGGLAFVGLDERWPRTPGNRNVCMNNQHNIALALLQYAESRHGHLPGYANLVNHQPTSYVIPILPYLERNDLYETWDHPGADGPAKVYMPLFVCPSNPLASPGPHSTPNAYVINGGQVDRSNPAPAAQLQAGGIAYDLTVADPVVSTIDYIAAHDGTHWTLLLAENTQLGDWAETDVNRLSIDSTFLWWNVPPSKDQRYRINVGREISPRPAGEPILSRPASNHPGGMDAVFCDGRGRFIAEDIDDDVYKQLLTPNGAESGDVVNRPIDDSDF